MLILNMQIDKKNLFWGTWTKKAIKFLNLVQSIIFKYNRTMIAERCAILSTKSLLEKKIKEMFIEDKLLFL